MNIKFEKDGVVKETHEKFTEDLLAVGWVVVKEPKAKETKPKEIKFKAPKRKKDK